MSLHHYPGADLAPRHAARKAAPLKDEDPGLAGGGVFQSSHQIARRQPRACDCDQHGTPSQQIEVHRRGYEPRMSSLEVARLTGKRHDNVMADARKMLAELYGPGGFLDFQDTQVNEQNGQRYPILLLPKRETLVLVSGYSVPMRARIIDRLQELDRRMAPIPRTLPEALRLAADIAEKAAEAAEALAVAGPKAAGLDRIAAASEGAVSIRVAAKVADVPEQAFIDFLIERGWIYRQGVRGSLLGKSDKERAGYLEMKRIELTLADGSTKAVARLFITSRGLAKVAEMIERQAPNLRKSLAKCPSQRRQLVLWVAPVDAQAVEDNS